MRHILLTGTFSAGKTTVLELFDTSVQRIPEVARELLTQNPNLIALPEFQEMILAEQLKREVMSKESQAEVVICDRGTLDVIVYSRYFGHPEPQVEVQYDHIYLCSPEGVPCAYGPEAESMRAQLHQLFLEVLAEKQLPFTVLEGLPSTRYQRIAVDLQLRSKEGQARFSKERDM